MPVPDFLFVVDSCIDQDNPAIYMIDTKLPEEEGYQWLLWGLTSEDPGLKGFRSM